MSCFILLKGDTAEGGDVLWLTVSVTECWGWCREVKKPLGTKEWGLAVLSEPAVQVHPLSSPLGWDRK